MVLTVPSNKGCINSVKCVILRPFWSLKKSNRISASLKKIAVHLVLLTSADVFLVSFDRVAVTFVSVTHEHRNLDVTFFTALSEEPAQMCHFETILEFSEISLN